MHNRLWICDVNGVLVDSTSLICDAFAATAEHFDFAWTERELAQVKGLWLLEAYRVLDSERDPFLLREFHLKYCRTRIEEVRAFAGVADVLAHARACGVRIAAATSHGELAEATLVATGLYPLIDCLLTQEEVRRPKPHPEILLRILSLFDIAPHSAASREVVYVGDTVADIEAGRAAGVRTVAAAYGISSEVELRNAKPDNLIRGFREMLSVAPLEPERRAAAVIWSSTGRLER